MILSLKSTTIITAIVLASNLLFAQVVFAQAVNDPVLDGSVGSTGGISGGATKAKQPTTTKSTTTKSTTTNSTSGSTSSTPTSTSAGTTTPATGTEASANKDNNTDYQSLQARDYAGKEWMDGLKIQNPSGINDIAELGTKIINWLLLILGLVATVMIIYAAILLVFNGGNEAQIKKAKTTLTWAIIGLVVSLGAFAIVNIIQSIL